jgi:hypothetical protein
MHRGPRCSDPGWLFPQMVGHPIGCEWGVVFHVKHEGSIWASCSRLANGPVRPGTLRAGHRSLATVVPV